jgi:hypothetical protein
MFNRTADLLDQIAIRLRSSAERLAKSAEGERQTDIYISRSHDTINKSRRLLDKIAAVA